MTRMTAECRTDAEAGQLVLVMNGAQWEMRSHHEAGVRRP